MLQQVPPVANFSLPYVDTFDLVANDTTPKYTSDMAGVFTAISVDDVPGKVLQQQTNSPVMYPWRRRLVRILNW